MPTAYMLIGVPGAGKSTWITNQSFDWEKTALISSDAIIDRRAEEQGRTYSDVFQSEIKSATAEMTANLKAATAAGQDIVWDQTNLTAKARKGKLMQIPDAYTKVAVYFNTPDSNELTRRLASRPGKLIPRNIVLGMISQIQKPTEAEGFDRIIEV